MSASQILQHLYSLDISSPGISRLIYGLIRHDEEEHYLSSLRGSGLARLVNFLDEALDAIPTADDVSRQCLRKLQVICGDNMTLPSSYTISGDLARVGDEPVAFGGFADVWEGTHCGRKVCIKALRVYLSDGHTLTKRSLFGNSRHPNVVSFIGVTTQPLQIMSEWMPNGTLTEYIEKNPGANRVGLLLDVAEGLNYLHTNHTIHADLKGPNILVDRGGHARLTDFGLASIVLGMSSVLVTQPQGYTAGWAAPEILMGADGITQEADMFAFGTVVIEAFTGRNPFSGFKAPFIVLQILNGERPARPQEARELGLVDSVWDMTLSCWQEDPSNRPTAAEVVRFLRECYTLHAANMSLPTLAPWRRAGSVDDATNHFPHSNGKPTPTQSQGSSHHSDKSSSQASGLSPEPLPDEYHALSNSVRADNQGAVRTSRAFSEEPVFETVRRIDKIAEELAHGNPWLVLKNTAELRRLCRHHGTIPTSYKLEGIVREGNHSQRISQVIEIWKGRYGGEAVALKVIKVSRRDPHILAFKRQLCEKMVSVKQLKHDNLLPFYGVSTTVADFCLVSPWCKNGNIVEYVKKNPGINRFNLLSDAARGLRFRHENGLVLNSLRQSHILIDDSGAARLEVHSVEDIDNYRYSAPETQFPKDRSESITPHTYSKDVYAMGMIVYEVLTGSVPYSECDDVVTLSNIRAGKIPQRPSKGIPDPLWQLLEKCWKSRSVHPVIEELPERLELRVQSIKISFIGAKKQRFFVKFKYGNERHTTSLTTGAAPGDEHAWDYPETWSIETDEHRHSQLVSFKVLYRTSTAMLKRNKVCATGEFSLLGSANKQTQVKLEVPGGTGVAMLKIFLTAI